MEEKRKNLRRHIKAATDWLQQADKSIEQEDDVKGDLKLMLAKAELKNAEKHQNSSRLIKFLSFVTAAAIAFIVIYFGDDSSKELTTNISPSSSIKNSSAIDESVVQNSPLPTTQSKENIEESIQTANAPTPIYEPDYVAPINEEVNNSWRTEESYSEESSKYIEPEPVFEESTKKVESTFASPQENPSVALEARTPTEDMQKLMQSAGQILRAE